MAEKVSSLADATEFEPKEQTEKELELVDIISFEGKISEKVCSDDLEDMYAIAQEMVKFAHARNGIGLTLPQIGINKRGFVFLSGDDKWEMMLNPEYFATGKKANVYERSLSYEGVYAIPRFKKINTAYYTINVDEHDRLVMKKQYRMMSGLKSFVFQSLVDTLDGKTAHNSGVFVDTKEETKSEE